MEGRVASQDNICDCRKLLERQLQREEEQRRAEIAARVLTLGNPWQSVSDLQNCRLLHSTALSAPSRWWQSPYAAHGRLRFRQVSHPPQPRSRCAPGGNRLQMMRRR